MKQNKANITPGMDIDFRTEARKLLDERNAFITERFAQIRKNDKEASKTAIYRAISRELAGMQKRFGYRSKMTSVAIGYVIEGR